MYSVKLNINDTIFDKIMFFLNNVSKEDIKIEVKKEKKEVFYKTNLVDFFQQSPLNDTISITRGSEIYKDRISF